MSRLQAEMLRFIRREKLIDPGDSVLVALSGGKDSVCLLLALKSIQRILHFSLAACHVHHGIRGKEAERDLLFSMELCREKEISFLEKRVNVPEFASEHKMGLEEAARILRYKALREALRDAGCNKIAVAHTLSDQAETVLFHLIRGAGSVGLGGMRAKNEEIIRPLLPFPSEEILLFLEENGQKFIQDSTNSDNDYTRNRIRNRILPELHQINPNFSMALYRFSEIQKRQNLLTKNLISLWKKENGLTDLCEPVPIEALRRLAEQDESGFILYAVFCEMAKKKNISIDFVHFDLLFGLLKRPQEGKIIQIAKQCGFTVENKSLVFKELLLSPDERNTPPEKTPCPIRLDKNELEAWDAVLRIRSAEGKKRENIHKNHLIIIADFGKIEGSILVRAPLPGECIRMYGKNKKILQLFSDAKIPKKLRSFIPILCDEKEAIWVPFFGLCDKVRPETGNGALFSIELEGKKLCEIEEFMTLTAQKRRKENEGN